MRTTKILVLVTLCGLMSCTAKKQKDEVFPAEQQIYIEVINDDYELYKPIRKSKAVLILFAGFGQGPKDIGREFDIIDTATSQGIAVVLMNYKSQLWLEESQKKELAIILQGMIAENKLPSEKIYLGGFSSGGIFSLLVSDYLIGSKEYHINPDGVFAIDSPVDLSGIYKYCQNSIKRKFSEVSVRESNYLIMLLEDNLGNPVDNIKAYEERSVFTISSDYIDNVKNLKDIKVRFYAEPDLDWWKNSRMMNAEELNAFYIEKLSASLKSKGFTKVDYIETENRGYKANGQRHPHSWSIVDKMDLVDWILGE